MSKNLIKNKKLMTILTVTTLLSVPLIAKPVMQKITAYLNPSIEYVYDNKDILDDVKTITYKNQNYIPVTELATALGKEVTYKNGVVTITTPKEEDTPTAPEKVTIAKATIKSVDKANKQVTILPAGKKDQVENYIVLNVSDTETSIRHEKLKKVVTLGDLEKGMAIQVVHASIMTASLPPQTSAFEIIVKASNEDLTESDNACSTVTNGKLTNTVIKEINHGQRYLIVSKDGQNFKMAFTNKTAVEFDDSDKKGNVNSLKVGQSIDVEFVHGVAMDIEINN